MSESKQLNEGKKWHQKWWGVTFLIIVSVAFIYLGTFIYEVVAGIESTVNLKKQQVIQSYALSQGDNSQVNLTELLETKDDPFFGDENAELVIVEFSDFECPFCKESFPIVRKIMEEYKDNIKFIYRDFPNADIHPNALNAALAAECAHEQDMFWPYHDKIFTNQNNMSISNLKSFAVSLNLNVSQFNECLDSQKYLKEVQNDLQDGMRFNVRGTPTFFIAGNSVRGVIPYETFKLIITNALQSQLEDGETN